MMISAIATPAGRAARSKTLLAVRTECWPLRLEGCWKVGRFLRVGPGALVAWACVSDRNSAPGARWAGSGLPLPLALRRPYRTATSGLPLPLWVRVDGVAEACRGFGWLG